MTTRPSAEFNMQATPGPELRRRLAYLAAMGNDSVITGGLTSLRRFGAADSKGHAKDAAADILMMNLMRDAAYRQTCERVITKLDQAGEAVNQALREIDQELSQNQQQREQMRTQAYKLPDGTAVFLGADGNVYDENGRKLSNAEREKLPMDKLQSGPRYEDWKQLQEQRKALQDERDRIEDYEQWRKAQRERIENGNLPQEELERIERENDQRMPDRVRGFVDASPSAKPQTVPGKKASTTLSADEFAKLDGPDKSAAFKLSGGPDFPKAPAAKTDFSAVKDGSPPKEDAPPTDKPAPGVGPSSLPGQNP